LIINLEIKNVACQVCNYELFANETEKSGFFDHSYDLFNHNNYQ